MRRRARVNGHINVDIVRHGRWWRSRAVTTRKKKGVPPVVALPTVEAVQMKYFLSFFFGPARRTYRPRTAATRQRHPRHCAPRTHKSGNKTCNVIVYSPLTYTQSSRVYTLQSLAANTHCRRTLARRVIRSVEHDAHRRVHACERVVGGRAYLSM